MAQRLALNSQVDAVAQSLRATAEEINTIEAAALRLAAAGNERAALGEQVSVATESIAASIEEASAMAAKMAKGQHGLTELAQSLLGSVEESTTALREVASSIAAVKKDTQGLAESSGQHGGSHRRVGALDPRGNGERSRRCRG